jgi:hypothetical protein
MRRIVVGSLLCVVAVLSLPAVASAGTYVDYECAGPTNGPLNAGGFAPSETQSASATNTCGSAGGTLDVGLTGAGPWTGGLGGTLAYSAPTDTRISGVTVDRATSGAPAVGGSFLTYQINVDSTLVDGCLPGLCTGDVSGTVTRSGLDAASLTLIAGCGGVNANTCTTPIRLAVTRAAVALRDDLAPTVANVRGSLFAVGPKAGTAAVVFDGADRGAGVYRTITTLDGKPYSIQPLALGNCSDVDPTNANPFEFAAKVPCPLSQQGLTVNVDTTKLADGAHTIGVVLQDASGNDVDVVAPNTKFTVRNAKANGTPGGRVVNGRLRMFFAANRTQNYTSVVGERVVVRGYLRDKRGRGIRGAEIEVYHYVAGRARLLKTGLRSRRYGRVTLILPRNLFGDAKGDRRIAFYYRAYVPGAVTSRQNVHIRILKRNGQPQTRSPNP